MVRETNTGEISFLLVIWLAGFLKRLTGADIVFPKAVATFSKQKLGFIPRMLDQSN
jgi:hypothetical protein